MTGHGRGESVQADCRVEVELSSVNQKHLVLRVALPMGYECLEAQVRSHLIGSGLSRGKVSAHINIDPTDKTRRNRVFIDRDLARECVKELRELARSLRLYGGANMETLMSVPGIVRSEEQSPDRESVWPLVRSAIDRALEGLRAMRSQEGREITARLSLLIEEMRQATGRVRLRAQKSVDRFREHLQEQIRRLTQEPLDEDRLIQEVVIHASRVDITEELDRLNIHYQQLESLVGSRKPVGRTLDFLAQEIFREINTIGSKASDSHISREVVTLKTHLDRFREQVQNVE